MVGGRGESHKDGWGRGDPIRMVGEGGSHKDGWGEGDPIRMVGGGGIP